MIGALGAAPNPDSQASAPPPDEPAPPSSDTPLLADASTAATLPAHLEGLAETARDYAKASSSHNTRKAYASDWRHYTGWARRNGLPACPRIPGHRALHRRLRLGGRRPQTLLGAHDRASAFGAHVEFRPAGRKFRPQGSACRHRPRWHSQHARPAARAEGGGAARGSPGDDRDAGSRRPQGGALRDRPILLLGFAGGLRRSECAKPPSSA